MTAFALYIHYPWCESLCHYCDYNRFQRIRKAEEDLFLSALIEDIKSESSKLKKQKICSIYFGGGTPSKLAINDLSKLMDEIFSKFKLKNNCEISIEINPEDASFDYLIGLKSLGFNRISLGAQSFDDSTLAYLGRKHKGQDVIEAINNIRHANFNNLNVDLISNIYCSPNPNRCLEDIKKLLIFNPEHLSLYEVKSNANAKAPDSTYDDTWFQSFFELQQLLFKNKYIQYELNSYAKTNYECLHYLNYWTFGDYLGLGAGASSKFTVHNSVICNVRPCHPRDYVTKVYDKKDTSHKQWIQKSPANATAEYLMLSTRLMKGFKLSDFHRKAFVVGFEEWEDKIDAAKKKGLLLEENGFVKPTPLGFRFLDDLHLVFIS